MKSGSRLWLVSAGLLVLAAVCSVVALVRYWQPCAPSIGADAIPFTDECIVAMDQFTTPLVAEGAGSLVRVLSLVASLALSAAWLVVVPTVRAGVVERALLALPGLAVFCATVWSAAAPPDGEAVPGWAFVLVDVLILPAALVLIGRGIGGAQLFRYVLVLLAATSVGVAHQLADFVLALGVSQASWDSPPGSGVPTALAILATAVANVVLWNRAGRAQSPTASLPRETSSGSGSPTIAVSLPS